MSQSTDCGSYRRISRGLICLVAGLSVTCCSCIPLDQEISELRQRSGQVEVSEDLDGLQARKPTLEELDVWVRTDDAFAGSIIEFTPPKQGVRQAVLIYASPEMQAWGFKHGDLKIKQFKRVASNKYECQSLTKVVEYRTGPLLSQEYCEEVIRVDGDEMLMRQKEGSDQIVGEWQLWRRVRNDPVELGHYAFGKAQIATMIDEWHYATQYFLLAAKLQPKDAAILNLVAWHFATCPDESEQDGELAIKLAKRACDLTNFNDYNLIDTLAAAYARTGDFSQAARYQRQAIQVMSRDYYVTYDFEARLTLYRRDRAYDQGMNLASIPRSSLGQATGASPDLN